MLSLMLVSCSIRNGIGTFGLTNVEKLIGDRSIFHPHSTNLDDLVVTGENPVVSMSNTTSFRRCPVLCC